MVTEVHVLNQTHRGQSVLISGYLPPKFMLIELKITNCNIFSMRY